MKLGLLSLLAKFACLSLAVNFSTVNALNCAVVIYLSWWSSVVLFLTSPIFVLYSAFLLNYYH